MQLEIYGVDLLDVFFRGTHALAAAAWLLFDFLVFWLHFDVKNPTIPVERRPGSTPNRSDRHPGLPAFAVSQSSPINFRKCNN